jgi:hypothetical protein
MKFLVPLSFIPAFVAFVFLPLSFEIGAAALVSAGLLAIAVSDYSRRFRPLPVDVRLPSPRREKLRLAA